MTFEGLIDYPYEEWRIITEKEVPYIQPWYAVSNFGRVYNFKDKRLLHPTVASNHLYIHIICLINGKSKDTTRPIHRLMMLTFNYFPGCEEYEVDHIDENSYNNVIYNLQWLTREENIAKEAKAVNNRYKTMLRYKDSERMY